MGTNAPRNMSPGPEPENDPRNDKRRIVFVSLFGLTELYLAVAGKLPKEHVSVFWITTNEFWTRYLISRGTERSHILQLVYSPDDFLDDDTKAALTRDIVEGERESGLPVNRILLMDRFLREHPRENVNEYVYLYYRDIRRFLRDNGITHVFAEPTNINDLLTYMVCRELKISYISPRDMRYPPRRLVFFDGYLQDRILPVSGGASAANGHNILESFADRKPTPYYFEKLNSQRVIYPHKIARAAVRRMRLRGIVSGRSLTHYDAWGRAKLTARRAANTFYLKHLCRYGDAKTRRGRLAFYGLHVQPENSIDVLGPYVDDQLKLVKDIRRSLPFDFTLLVKEHPNFLGMKPIRFFRQLRRIPNVTLIRHDVPTFDLYDRVDLVLTVSGTAAYEAGMLGVPAVTFSPMYFGGLSSVAHCPDIRELTGVIEDLLDKFERDYDADCRFMETLLRYSHDAYWTDPLFDRSVLDPQNIHKITGAFMALLQSWSLSTLSA